MKSLFSLSIVVALSTLCGTLTAGEACCDGCGCRPCTRKVCKLVCETKKTSKPDYKVECEDFCVPGPSIKCRVPCPCPGRCTECCGDGCHIVWKPTCGKVRTRVNLVVGKKEKEEPSYKCVVEEVCARCGHCAHRTNYPAAKDAATAIAVVGEDGKNVVADASVEPSIAARLGEIEAASHSTSDAAAPQTARAGALAIPRSELVALNAGIPAGRSLFKRQALRDDEVSTAAIADDSFDAAEQHAGGILDRLFRR